MEAADHSLRRQHTSDTRKMYVRRSLLHIFCVAAGIVYMAESILRDVLSHPTFVRSVG